MLADSLKTGQIGEAGSWVVEGIGEDFVPAIADLSRVTKAFTISDFWAVARGMGFPRMLETALLQPTGCAPMRRCKTVSGFRTADTGETDLCRAFAAPAVAESENEAL